jgi:signal transduction histidine kinase
MYLNEAQCRRKTSSFRTFTVIARHDCSLKYIYVSPELERATGISPDQFVGKSLREVPLQDYDWQSLEASCHEAIAEKKTIARELHDGTAQNLIPASYLVLRNDT